MKRCKRLLIGQGSPVAERIIKLSSLLVCQQRDENKNPQRLVYEKMQTIYSRNYNAFVNLFDESGKVNAKGNSC
ncbi:hypothetical protein N9L33_04755 [Nitrospinae bacterium]|nr:hypothetical protein [Nitrospinota bacterium]